MSEEFEESQPQANDSKEPLGLHSEALLQSAIERLKARGDSTRRFGCMSLPAPVFNDLCARLLDPTKTVKGTSEWLAGQVPDAPTRSSVERFSDALFEEYRLAEYDHARGKVTRYLNEALGNDPVKCQVAAGMALSDRITSEILAAGPGGYIDTERLRALIGGYRTVVKTELDKRNTDARVQALQKLVEEKDARIAHLQADLLVKEQRAKAETEKLKREAAAAAAAAEKVAKDGGDSSAVVSKVREILGIQA